MSLSAVRHIASPRSLETKDDAQAYQEHLLAEFVFARAAHGVLDGTIRQDVAAVEEFLGFAGLLAWEIEPGHADRFLGQAQRDRAVATRRGKAICIDTFYRFLELRYRGEIHQLTGHLVCSPIDSVNRPAHTGDFAVRIPPTPAELHSFFLSWRAELPEVRKWLVASRNYTMARLLGDVGLSALAHKFPHVFSRRSVQAAGCRSSFSARRFISLARSARVNFHSKGWAEAS